MLSIAICDDQPLHGEVTANAVREHMNDAAVEIRIFESPKELLSEIKISGYMPRIAILDIRMEELDGISLAKQINGLCSSCAVIFLTAYLAYATDVYDAAHIYFIVKSELKERIGPAIEKALRSQPVSSPLLYYRADASIQTIPAAEILYMERCLRRTKLQTQTGTLWSNDLPNALLKDDTAWSFIRCHHSYWINFRHIRAMNNDSFILDDGSDIPITRTYRKTAKEQFFACIRITTESGF